MTAVAPNSEAAKLEYSKLTQVQKLAAFLLLLEPANATTIMKNLDEHLLESVAAEMTNLPIVPQHLQGEILREFSEMAVEAAAGVAGGADLTHKLLEQSVGLFRASEIMSRVSSVRPPVPAIQNIIDMDPRRIFNLLRHEQPQTIAMLLSYLTPEKSASVLELLRPEIRDQILERIATLSPTSADVVEDVVDVLYRNSGGQRVRLVNKTGGAKVAAQVLNALPKNISKAIITSLGERNAELTEAVRQKMFTFEDLSRLEVRSLQKIMQTVDMRTLTIALRAANEQVRETLLGAISKRAADNVRDELQLLEPLKLKEIEAAQLEIVNSARQLESEGEIDLNEIN